MRMKSIFLAAAFVAIAIGFAACSMNKSGDASARKDNASSQVIDNKDEMTFLRTFLDKYLSLSGKQAQELAKENLTTEFYSDYIEQCSNKDDAVDLICEVAMGEKVNKVEKIEKGIEEPGSFIVQVEATGLDGEPFSTQYDMTVVNENGKFKLSDSQIND